MSLVRTIISAFLVLGACSSVQAAIIVSWNFTDMNGTADFADPRINVPIFTPGPGLVASTFAAFNASAAGFDATTALLAVTAGDYWEFTVTADSGYLIDLQSLTFTDTAALQGPTTFQLWINGNLFGAEMPTSLLVPGVQTVDLTAVNTLSSHTIRIYGFGAPDPAAAWVLDDVALAATIVPEPSSLLLASIAFPGVYLVRRRRQQQLAAKQSSPELAS